MKKRMLFSLTAVLLLCVSCVAASALASDSDATVATTGKGTSGDPYVIWANLGDKYTYTAEGLAYESGALPVGLNVKTDEKSLTGTFIHVQKCELVLKDKNGLVYFTFNVVTGLKELVSGKYCRGYGTADNPWKFIVSENRELRFEFIAHGTLASASGLPANLAVHGSAISGTLSENSAGSYHVTVMVNGVAHYLDISVTGLYPSWVPFLIIAGCIAVTVILGVKWGARTKE